MFNIIPAVCVIDFFKPTFFIRDANLLSPIAGLPFLDVGSSEGTRKRPTCRVVQVINGFARQKRGALLRFLQGSSRISAAAPVLKMNIFLIHNF